MKAGRFGKGRILNYANRVRGALVAYKQRDMGAGGRGTHIRDIPSVASAEAAQRLLQPPRAAGAARRSSSGPGAALGHPRAALGRPTSKPRAATAKPCPLRGDGRRWKETHRAPDFNSNFSPTYRRRDNHNDTLLLCLFPSVLWFCGADDALEIRMNSVM